MSPKSRCFWIGSWHSLGMNSKKTKQKPKTKNTNQNTQHQQWVPGQHGCDVDFNVGFWLWTKAEMMIQRMSHFLTKRMSTFPMSFPTNERCSSLCWKCRNCLKGPSDDIFKKVSAPQHSSTRAYMWATTTTSETARTCPKISEGGRKLNSKQQENRKYTIHLLCKEFVAPLHDVSRQKVRRCSLVLTLVIFWGTEPPEANSKIFGTSSAPWKADSIHPIGKLFCINLVHDSFRFDET